MVVIVRKYSPTEASIIRALTFAKGMAKNGEIVKVLFFMQNNNVNLPPDNGRVSYKCITDGIRLPHKILQAIIAFIRIWKYIDKNDTIVQMSFFPSLFIYLSLFCKDLYHDRTELSSLSFEPNFWGHVLERLYLSRVKKTKGVFVISNSLKEDLISKGIPDSMIHLMSMMVDFSRFNGLQKAQTEQYICYCGTVSNYKDGVDNLIKAFSIVHKKYPTVKLYILGPYFSDEDRKTNEKIITDNNLQDYVFQPGIVPYEEMPSYLTNATILALARPDNEQSKFGFPNKLGEYLITGNPVVVTRVGELNQYLEDMDSCVFTEPDNYIDFSEKLLWCLDNREAAKVIGMRGYEVANTSFNYLLVTKRIITNVFNVQ